MATARPTIRGTSGRRQSPALPPDVDSDGRASWQEMGRQLRAGPATDRLPRTRSAVRHDRRHGIRPRSQRRRLLTFCEKSTRCLYLSVAGPCGLVESGPELHTELVMATRGCLWNPIGNKGRYPMSAASARNATHRRYPARRAAAGRHRFSRICRPDEQTITDTAAMTIAVLLHVASLDSVDLDDRHFAAQVCERVKTNAVIEQCTRATKMATCGITLPLVPQVANAPPAGVRTYCDDRFLLSPISDSGQDVLLEPAGDAINSNASPLEVVRTLKSIVPFHRARYGGSDSPQTSAHRCQVGQTARGFGAVVRRILA